MYIPKPVGSVPTQIDVEYMTNEASETVPFFRWMNDSDAPWRFLTFSVMAVKDDAEEGFGTHAISVDTPNVRYTGAPELAQAGRTSTLGHQDAIGTDIIAPGEQIQAYVTTASALAGEVAMLRLILAMEG